MIGLASLPRNIQKLADAKGWEEDDLLGAMATFEVKNSLEAELLEFLQEEGEKVDGTLPEEQDENDPNLDD